MYVYMYTVYIYGDFRLRFRDVQFGKGIGLRGERIYRWCSFMKKDLGLVDGISNASLFWIRFISDSFIVKQFLLLIDMVI